MGKDTTAATGAHVKEREKQIVLIVDGDITRQFYTTIFLQRLNYHVFPVKTAEEALMIMELTVPLLVITDVTLPRMSGTDLLRSIKQNLRTWDVPVLIYTALKAPADRDACKEAGCAGYLTEPADHSQLYEAVQNATETTPRHFIRLDTSLDVVVEGGAAAGGGERKERVTAISEHGMYVNTPDPMPYGTTVPFTLYLDRAMAWGIRVEGMVLYSHSGASSGKLPGMGVKFVLIRPDDRNAIRNFIREKLMSGLATAGPLSEQ